MITDQPTLSVVVPCFNEEESIRECHERLTSVLRGAKIHYEIVYVNDGSKDKTALILANLQSDDYEHIVSVTLSRNFGHQAAVTAGLEASRGKAAVIIDADLQDPPELIPEMVRLWQSGYHVVFGLRASRAGESSLKLVTAKYFYKIINRLADVEIPLDTGDFRLVSRQVVDTLLAMPERHRLLRGMFSWVGFSQVGLKYDRAARFAGHTKYPMSKMLKLATDGVISFSTVPLRLVTYIGLASACFSLLGIVYSLIVRIGTHEWVRGWAISFIGTLFLGGVQMLCLGVFGEYLGRIYTEIKQRPLYIVESCLRGPAVFTARAGSQG